MSTVKASNENKAIIDGIFNELNTNLKEHREGLNYFNIIEELGLDNGQIETIKKKIDECQKLIESAYANVSGSQEEYLKKDYEYATKLYNILELYKNNIVSGDTNV